MNSTDYYKDFCYHDIKRTEYCSHCEYDKHVSQVVDEYMDFKMNNEKISQPEKIPQYLEEILGAAVEVPIRKKPLFVVSRKQVVIFIVVMYVLLNLYFVGLLHCLYTVQNYYNNQWITPTIIFAVVMFFPFIWLIYMVLKRSLRPKWPESEK